MSYTRDFSMKHERLQKGPNGRNLCRWCKKECPRKQLTFCPADASGHRECLHQWKIRSDHDYRRAEIFKRDKGVCAMCRRDTVRWAGEIWAMQADIRAEYDGRLKLGCRWIKPEQFWEADHIVPVVEGGGGCGLEGYRSLCLPCHRLVTKALMRRLFRAKAKKKMTTDTEGKV